MQRYSKIADSFIMEKIHWKNMFKMNITLDNIYIIEEIINKELSKCIHLKNLSKNWKIINEIQDSINAITKIHWNILLMRAKKIAISKRYIFIIDWLNLSEHETRYIIKTSRTNPDKINWGELCRNTNSNIIQLLKKNINILNNNMLNNSSDEMYWTKLSSNTNSDAIQLLKDNQDKICWGELSENKNPDAIKLLRQNSHEIVWESLSRNQSSDAIQLLRENTSFISWDELSSNENSDAIQLLRENQDKIDWNELSSNENSDAIQLLRENQDKINWEILFINKCLDAAELLKMNSDKLPKKNSDKVRKFNKWNSRDSIFRNPLAIVTDYKAIGERMNIFKEEMMKKIFHPINCDKFIEWGFNE